MLLDDQADRIEAALDGADRGTLVRWVKELLADRRARSALLQGQTRRVACAKRRLHQAATYLSGPPAAGRGRSHGRLARTAGVPDLWSAGDGRHGGATEPATSA